MKDYMAEWKKNSIRIGAPTVSWLRSLHLSRYYICAAATTAGQILKQSWQHGQ